MIHHHRCLSPQQVSSNVASFFSLSVLVIQVEMEVLAKVLHRIGIRSRGAGPHPSTPVDGVEYRFSQDLFLLLFSKRSVVPVIGMVMSGQCGVAAKLLT